MATNLKILKGSLDTLPTSKTEGQIYFATSSDKENGNFYKGKIFVDIDPNTRISFGEHADTAISDPSGNEIISTYLNGLSITDVDFNGNSSEENLYLRGFTPSGKQIPSDQSDWLAYTIPAANADTPGLLSLVAQTIYGEKTFQNLSYFTKGLSADNNSSFAVSIAPDSLIQDSNFNIALNGNTNGILFKSSSATNNGFIQYNYSNSIEELIIGINNHPQNNNDRVIIQSSGEDSLLHYNDRTQTYSTIFDTENFQSLQISISGSTTDYNENVTEFNFNGSQSINIHAGNAYQDMTNTVADSSTSTSGINASTLGGYSYLDIAAEMLLSDAEVAELVG